MVAKSSAMVPMLVRVRVRVSDRGRPSCSRRSSTRGGCCHRSVLCRQPWFDDRLLSPVVLCCSAVPRATTVGLPYPALPHRVQAKARPHGRGRLPSVVADSSGQPCAGPFADCAQPRGRNVAAAGRPSSDERGEARPTRLGQRTTRRRRPRERWHHLSGQPWPASLPVRQDRGAAGSDLSLP